MAFLHSTPRLIILVALFACTSKQSDKKTIHVAVSANFYSTFLVLQKKFEENSDIRIETSISSTGKLTAQIMSGAPYDIFLAADSVHPTLLLENGHGIGKSLPYAKGLLSFWSKEPIKSLEDLDIKPEDRVGIPNPKTAPYGRAAQNFLLELNLKPDLLVHGESVSQVNSFIKSQSLDFAITSGSFTLTQTGKGKGYLIPIDTTYYSPLIQSALLLSDKPEAVQFVQFLLSDKSQKIIANFGYLPVENE